MDISNFKSREDLKSYFVKNAIPTESNFAELIESILNQRDDGLVKAPGVPLSIAAVGDASSQKKVINLYADFSEDKPHWVLSLNPRKDPNSPQSARLGFSISDAEGNSRLFIDRGTGRVGVGTVAPADELDVGGGMRVLSDTNPLRFTSVWSGFPNEAVNHAEISNDTGVHKTLMIVGNKSAGMGRRVSIWDRLEVNGSVVVNGAGTLNFGATVRQMINLWKTSYGIGVQSNTQYFRSNRNFVWYKGGTHADGQLDAGGGIVQMVINDRNVGIGTAAPRKQLHIQEGEISAPLLNEQRRPGIALTGQYPEINLFSRVNNTNHGPTIRLGSYDADTGDATKQWSIGTAGRNSRFLDIGFSTTNNGNPHNGIRNHSGTTVLTLLENGNVGIGVNNPLASLTVKGQIIREVVVATGLGPGDGIDEGQIVSRTLQFTKHYTDTAIRIVYCDNLRINGSNVASRWEIRIDGSAPPDGMICQDKYTSTTGGTSNQHEPSTIVGFARGVSAGSHTIEIWVGKTPTSHKLADAYTGWINSRWTIEAEEVWIAK